MIKYIKIYYFLILFSICYGVNGQDHLIPLEGVLFESDFSHEYHMNIRKVLIGQIISDKYGEEAEVQLIITPSFSPESELAIRYDWDNDNYRIMYGKCEKSIWKSKGDLSNKIKLVDKLIDTQDLILIFKLYETAINKTQYLKTSTTISENKIVKTAKGGLGNDGTNYYFSKSSFGIQAGKTWSPRKETLMNELVQINLEIIELLKNSANADFKLDENLSNRIEKLIIKIKK
jgi:hypothetical protein